MGRNGFQMQNHGGCSLIFLYCNKNNPSNKGHFTRVVLRFIRNFARREFFLFFERKLVLRQKQLGRIQYTFLDEIPKK